MVLPTTSAKAARPGVAIIDDDREYASNLAEYLGARRFPAQVFNCAEAFLAAVPAPFAYHIVDLGLPGLDGLDLLAVLRARGSRAIIVITGRLGPDAFNNALAAGADLYLAKPIRFDQVIFSIRALQRRFAPEAGEVETHWRLLPQATALHPPNGGAPIPLTPHELSLLTALALAEGATLSRRALTQHLGIEPGPDFGNLSALIYRLRRKIEAATPNPPPIRTVHGVGYAMGDAIALHRPRLGPDAPDPGP